MPPTPVSPDLAPLVTRGHAIKGEQKTLKAELDAIQAQLQAAGPGEYRGTNGEKVTVVADFVKMAPDAAAIEQVRDLLEEEEGGLDAFKKLFARTVSYAPVKGIRHVAAALLTPGKLRKLCALCEVPSPGFVMWPK